MRETLDSNGMLFGNSLVMELQITKIRTRYPNRLQTSLLLQMLSHICQIKWLSIATQHFDLPIARPILGPAITD